MVCQDCYVVPARRGEYTCAACAAKEPTAEQLERMAYGEREGASERTDSERRMKGERMS